MDAVAVQGSIGDVGNKPLTRLTGFSFNSLCSIGGLPLGASIDKGICLLNTGEYDNGSQFVRSVVFATTDFGIKNPKRIRFLYFGVLLSSDVTISVTVDNSNPVDYILRAASEYRLQRIRVPINSDMQGRYWRVSLSSYNRFVIDSIEAMVYMASSGIRG